MSPTFKGWVYAISVERGYKRGEHVCFQTIDCFYYNSSKTERLRELAPVIYIAHQLIDWGDNAPNTPPSNWRSLMFYTDGKRWKCYGKDRSL